MHVLEIEFAGFFKTFTIFADFFPCHATINIAEVRFEPMPKVEITKRVIHSTTEPPMHSVHVKFFYQTDSEIIKPKLTQVTRGCNLT